jgi:hypothetical protein
MMHIKGFNEGMSIEDFCESHLVSLLDIDGVKYFLNPNSHSHINDKGNLSFEVDRDCYCLIITFNTTLWSELSFELIPFLTLLNDSHDVIDMSVMYYSVDNGETKAITKEIQINELEDIDDKCYMRHFWINIDRDTF